MNLQVYVLIYNLMMNYNHIAGKKLEIKSAQNLKVEGRLLYQLDYLKKSGGPFTSCEEI